MQLDGRGIVGTAPAPVSPWQVPTGLLGQGGRHEIESRRSPWMASQDTSEGHPATRPKAEAVNGFIRVFRAARQMPAARPNQWREGDPIKRNKAAAGKPGQAGKSLMVRSERHSSSSGRLELHCSSWKFHFQVKSMELLAFPGV